MGFPGKKIPPILALARIIMFFIVKVLCGDRESNSRQLSFTSLGDHKLRWYTVWVTVTAPDSRESIIR